MLPITEEYCFIKRFPLPFDRVLLLLLLLLLLGIVGMILTEENQIVRRNPCLIAT